MFSFGMIIALSNFWFGEVMCDEESLGMVTQQIDWSTLGKVALLGWSTFLVCNYFFGLFQGDHKPIDSTTVTTHSGGTDVETTVSTVINKPDSRNTEVSASSPNPVGPKEDLKWELLEAWAAEHPNASNEQVDAFIAYLDYWDDFEDSQAHWKLLEAWIAEYPNASDEARDKFIKSLGSNSDNYFYPGGEQTSNSIKRREVTGKTPVYKIEEELNQNPIDKGKGPAVEVGSSGGNRSLAQLLDENVGVGFFIDFTETERDKKKYSPGAETSETGSGRVSKREIADEALSAIRNQQEPDYAAWLAKNRDASKEVRERMKEFFSENKTKLSSPSADPLAEPVLPMVDSLVSAEILATGSIVAIVSGGIILSSLCLYGIFLKYVRR